jgi:hypothetical protein
MKKLIILLLFPLFSYSQSWEMDVTLGSYHFNRYYRWYGEKMNFNEFNPGFILYKKENKFKIGGGVIVNSYGKVSYLSGIGYDFNDRVSVLGGLATGYKNTDINKMIYPLGMVTYKMGRFKIGATPTFVVGMLNFKF